jgi:xylan 1,4-beta-xylosidase
LSKVQIGNWWVVYHAYENGFYTLGRQTLLQLIEWLADGWFRATHDPDEPSPKPVPTSTGPHGFALSDDFSTNRMGLQWGFYKGGDADRGRYRYENMRSCSKRRAPVPPTAHRCRS